MWINEKISKSTNFPVAERGEITLSSDKNREAFATGKVRNPAFYSPYGFCSAAPAGEEVLLLSVPDGVAALGTKNSAEGLEAGEIRLRSKGGAEILLLNDGSILLNGTVIIDREGSVSGCRTN